MSDQLITEQGLLVVLHSLPALKYLEVRFCKAMTDQVLEVVGGLSGKKKRKKKKRRRKKRDDEVDFL